MDFFFKDQSFHGTVFQWKDSNLSGFIKKYLHLCFKDELKSYGFGMTQGWVDDRIVIFWWTIPWSEYNVIRVYWLTSLISKSWQSGSMFFLHSALDSEGQLNFSYAPKPLWTCLKSQD